LFSATYIMLLEIQDSYWQFRCTWYPRKPLHRSLLMVHAEMCVPLGQLCRPISEEFSDRVQIHTGHYQSTGEGVSVAMPGIVQ
jgi:hypothetical protein